VFYLITRSCSGKTMPASMSKGSNDSGSEWSRIHSHIAEGGLVSLICMLLISAHGVLTSNEPRIPNLTARGWSGVSVSGARRTFLRMCIVTVAVQYATGAGCDKICSQLSTCTQLGNLLTSQYFLPETIAMSSLVLT
jgi:NADH:ubiquinone oxidoreductase subunit 6 (subunit J)